jgi:Tfp pilus assembly protein PilE
VTLARRLHARFRREEGLTLPELLVALPISVVLLLVTVTVLNVSIKQSAAVTDRVEAIQRGRTTMERITRQLRSQVCPATTGAAITSASNNSITFYVDLTGGSSSPEQHVVTFDPTGGTITQYDYVGTGTWPNMSYPSVTRTSVLLANASAVSGTNFFNYYGYDSNGNVSTTAFTTPVSSTNLPKIVKVGVNFVAQPRHTTQAARWTTFQSEADVRTGDPTKPTQNFRCL